MKNRFLICLAALLGLVSCSKGYFDGYFDGAYSDELAPKRDGPSTADAGQGRPGGQAGVLTAGEWNDLVHWDFWSRVMGSEEYQGMSAYWRLYTPRRVSVRVADGTGKRLPAVKVVLEQDQQVLWSALVTAWNVQQAEADVNYYQLQTGPVPAAGKKADVAFIVDATGSMADEIDFLKKDLVNILDRVKGGQADVELRTGALFYRDEGDEYVTRHSDFTGDYRKTIDYIKQQYAAGGGDLPEAVHTALEAGLQNLHWNLDARARLAFLILDAPAHQDHQGVVESLQRSIEAYAAMGIKLIPVFCSSPSKECEFMCRFFAVLTGGTYVFLTDDSGVGNSHVEPSVGEFQVEPLNDLLARLIAKYIG